jgi:hypothetical protein
LDVKPRIVLPAPCQCCISCIRRSRSEQYPKACFIFQFKASRGNLLSLVRQLPNMLRDVIYRNHVSPHAVIDILRFKSRFRKVYQDSSSTDWSSHVDISPGPTIGGNRNHLQLELVISCIAPKETEAHVEHLH